MCIDVYINTQINREADLTFFFFFTQTHHKHGKDDKGVTSLELDVNVCCVYLADGRRLRTLFRM